MSPRNKELNEEVRNKSIEKILLSSFKLFAETGFHKTSISAIAKDAKVSKGLIYNYFDSKEELLKEVVQMLMKEGDGFEETMKKSDPKKAMYDLLNGMRFYIRERKEFWRLTISLSLQKDLENFDFIQELIKKKSREYLLVTEKMLKKIGIKNPRQEAMILGVIFDGIGLQSVAAGDYYPIDEIIDALIDKYCK